MSTPAPQQSPEQRPSPATQSGAPRYATGDDYRALNQEMAQSILYGPAEPYAEGGYVRRVVEIRGRRSRQLHQVALAVITLNGRRYLISPVLQRNWVSNLLAEPHCVTRSADEAEPAVAVPIRDADEVADVVHLYLTLMQAPWAVAQFPFPPDADRAQIRAVADQVAVLALDPG